MRRGLRIRELVLLAALLLLLLPSAAHARSVTLTGTVRVAHADDARLSTTRAHYLLDTASGPVRVRAAAGVRWFPVSGDRVRVRGQRRGDVVVVRQVRRLPGGKRLLGGNPVSGTRNIAVILVNFSDRQLQPFTKAQIEQRFFTNPDSVAAYYEQQSFGKLHLTGTVYDWVTVAAPSSSCSDWYNWGSAARVAAGVSIFEHNYVYVFPTVPSCGWAGLAFLPGQESWINGAADLRVMSHELGHNFGVHHASTMSCTSGATRVTLSATCDTPNEYGDPFTTMGSGSTYQFNGFHKAQLGWFDPANEQDATTTGSYTLRSSSAASAGVQSLRIRRSATEWIYCDLRTNTGLFDQFGAGNTATQGVMLRLGPDYSSQTQPKLLDATPSSGSFFDASLPPGQSFTDPVSGVTITAGAVSGGEATLQVEIPAAADLTPPGAPPGPAATVTGGDVQLLWGAATDNIGVTSYRVYRDGTLAASLAGTAWTDPGPPPGTVVLYAVAALDAAGNEGTRRSLAVTIPALPPGAPSGLAASASAGGTVLLTWAGAVRATGYRVLRDGVEIATVAGTQAGDEGLAPGSTHAYVVVSIDATGRIGGSSETVLATIPSDVVDPEDATPPSAPRGLTARRLAPLRVRLTWRAARDDVRVAHYRVERNGRLLLRTRYLGAVAPLLSRTAAATLTVRAVDAAGNIGRPARVVLPPRG